MSRGTTPPFESPARVAGYRFANVEIDEVRLVLKVDGREVKVEPLPLRLLLELLRAAPAVVGTDDLLDRFWPDAAVMPGAVSSAMHRLRVALGEPAQARIVNMRKSRRQAPGYRFDGAFDVLAASDAAAPAGRSAATPSTRPDALRATHEFLIKHLWQPAEVSRVANANTVSPLDRIRHASAIAAQQFESQPVVEAAIRRQLATAYLRVAAARWATEEFGLALALLDRLVPADEAEHLETRFGLVQALVANYQVDEAVRLLAETEHDAGTARLATASGLAVLALRARLDVLQALERSDEELQHAQRLVELTDVWHEADATDRFDARQRLGEIHFRREDWPGALAVLSEIAGPAYDSAEIEAVTFTRARLDLARVLKMQGRAAESRALLETLRGTATRALGPEALQVGYVNYELSDLYCDDGDFEAATQAGELALAALGASLGAEHGYAISVQANLAILQLIRGHAAQALLAIDSTLTKFRARGIATDGLDFYRAWALCDLGRAEQALAALDSLDMKALAWSSWGPDDWVARVQGERGRALRELGSKTEGEALLRAALRGMETSGSLPWVVERCRRQVLGHAGGDITVGAKPG